MRATSSRRRGRASSRRYSAPTSNEVTRATARSSLASSTSASVRSGPTLPNERYVRCRSVTTSGAPVASRDGGLGGGFDDGADDAALQRAHGVLRPVADRAARRRRARHRRSDADEVEERRRQGRARRAPSSTVLQDGRLAMSGLASRRGSTEKLIVARPTDRSSVRASATSSDDRGAPRAQDSGRAASTVAGRRRAGHVQREIGGRDPVRLRGRGREPAADRRRRASASAPARTAPSSPQISGTIGSHARDLSSAPSRRSASAGRAGDDARADSSTWRRS